MRLLASTHPFWSLGFRPFFLIGSGFLLCSLGLWLIFLFNPSSVEFYFSPLVWHGHEMVFGFSGAIVAGFLLTASQNWTGERGLHGQSLQILVLLWLLGRVALLTTHLPGFLVGAIDLAFFPWVCWVLFPYLTKADQRRNLIFLLLLLLFFLANLLVHLDHLGWLQGYGQTFEASRRGLLLGVHLLLVFVSIIGGRILPFFSKKVLKEASKAQSFPWLDRISVILVFGFALSSFLLGRGILVAWIAALVALVHGLRWLLWRPWQSLSVPILGILFLAYLWLIVAFFLEALSYFFSFSSTLALHGFTVGAIGIFIFAMITRVSLGHTGRPIKASMWTCGAYLFLFFAAIFRVLIPLWDSSYLLLSMKVSGVLWLGAFVIFVVQYGPLLLGPRFSK